MRGAEALSRLRRALRREGCGRADGQAPKARNDDFTGSLVQSGRRNDFERIRSRSEWSLALEDAISERRRNPFSR